MGEFYDGRFHGHGTLKFSVYVDCSFLTISRDDSWDVYTGNFRFGNMDGHGRLTYNNGPLGWLSVDDRPNPSEFDPPGGVGFRRLESCPDGTESDSCVFDKDCPRFSQANIYGRVGDVYTGNFRNNLFHGDGAYEFMDPDRGHMRYTATWESGRWIGPEPKLHLAHAQLLGHPVVAGDAYGYGYGYGCGCE